MTELGKDMESTWSNPSSSPRHKTGSRSLGNCAAPSQTPQVLRFVNTGSYNLAQTAIVRKAVRKHVMQDYHRIRREASTVEYSRKQQLLSRGNFGLALEEAISKDESRKSSDLLTWDRDDRESQKYMGLTLSPGRRTRGHVASDSTPECALVYGDGCKSLIYLLVEARWLRSRLIVTTQ